MSIIIGGARQDENGKYSGGKAGDQTGKEVCLHAMYDHEKGWVIERCTVKAYRAQIAANMKTICENDDIGYDQGNRLGIITYGMNTTTPTECDCGTAVREAIRKAINKDPGNFTTYNEKQKLIATGLFETVEYTGESCLLNGDVLHTKTKGHTVIVVSGAGSESDSGSGSSGNGSSGNGSSYDFDDIVKRTIRGEFGNGATRKARLEKIEKGLYAKVQAAINKLYKK